MQLGPFKDQTHALLGAALWLRSEQAFIDLLEESRFPATIPVMAAALLLSDCEKRE